MKKYTEKVTLFNFTKEISPGVSFSSPEFKEKAKAMILSLEGLNKDTINKIVEDILF